MTSYIEKTELRVHRDQENESCQDRLAERKVLYRERTPTTFRDSLLNILQSANHHMCVRKVLKAQENAILKD